mgnify:CR=1 FL=1
MKTLAAPRHRAVFISDVHLGSAHCHAAELANFLEGLHTRRLYLVGDIIDLWWMAQRRAAWGPDQRRVIDALQALARAGTELVYVPGNHDRPVRNFCGLVLPNMRLRRRAIHVTADGRRLLVTHGDSFDSVPFTGVQLASDDAMLASLAAQTRSPDEVVICDGGSTDGTAEALRAYAAAVPDRLPRVQVLEAPGANISQGRNLAIAAAEGPIVGAHVVLAAGAWSGELLGTLGLALPVEPVKGQMILYKCASDFLSSMVLAKGRYAIPRRDGHILIGSTLEHEGFDKTPTETALESLKASAVELIPALADAEVVGHWAGLRPGSPEGIPYIGRVPGLNGLWLNCGHYRNGLVLAPASCQLFADLLLERAPIIDPAPYAPEGRINAG